MNNDVDFKALWINQTAEIPDSKTFMQAADTYKRKALAKLVFTNIILLATCIFIYMIWRIYQPAYLTTKFGILLAILSMILYLVVYNQAIPLLLKTDYNTDNSKFLQQLLKLRSKQFFLQGTMLNIYFILLCLGIGLYMIEYVARMPLWGSITAYGLTAVWFAVNWFYLRPKIIRKQRAKLDLLIERLEAINRQLI